MAKFVNAVIVSRYCKVAIQVVWSEQHLSLDKLMTTYC
jgi:hypothetical protein